MSIELLINYAMEYWYLFFVGMACMLLVDNMLAEKRIKHVIKVLDELQTDLEKLGLM